MQKLTWKLARHILTVAFFSTLIVTAPALAADEDDGGDESRDSQSTSQDRSESFKRIHFDFGAATGTHDSQSFYEFHLGVDYYFLPWLYWRNAPFYRVETGTDSSYGWDTSIDGQYSFDISPDFTPHVTAGGGYRFTNTGSSAPFVEGGLGVAAKGVNLDVTAKHILHSAMISGAKNETVFTINVSGSGSL